MHIRRDLSAAPRSITPREENMHTKEALAALLDGREYRDEITDVEAAQAKAAGLVVVFGWSDDNMIFRGAIDSDVDAYDGTTARVTLLGVMPDWESVDKDDEVEAERYFEMKRAGFRQIKALWSVTPGYSWTFETDIPHATFEVVEGPDTYCRGIVFTLADLAAAAVR